MRWRAGAIGQTWASEQPGATSPTIGLRRRAPTTTVNTATVNTATIRSIRGSGAANLRRPAGNSCSKASAA
jgi:hypothetical protein